jgi:hypothetical protein
VRFRPDSRLVTTTLAPAILAPIASVTKPITLPVGTWAQTILGISSSKAMNIRMAYFIYGSAAETSEKIQPLVKPNAMDEFLKPGIAA